jgi:small-conductance mechanosensitive channel
MNLSIIINTQAAIIAATLTLGYATAYLINRLSPSFTRLKIGRFNLSFRMLVSLGILLWLPVAVWMSKIYLGDSSIIKIFGKFVLTIALIQILDRTINHRFKFPIIVIIVLPIILKFFGLLHPIANDLDDIRIEISNKFHLSLFWLIKAMYLGLFLFWVGRILGSLIKGTISTQQEWSTNTRELIIKLLDIVVYFILAAIGMNMLGIDITTLTIFSGSVVVAVGLSLQKLASSFLSGIIILIEKDIKVDDVIELKNGITGQVRALGARTTTIEEGNGNIVTIPNEDIINSSVVNKSMRKIPARLSVTIPVSYEANPNEVSELLLTTVNDANCLNSPPPSCVLKEFTDHGMIFTLSFSVKPCDEEKVKSNIMENIWHKLKERSYRFARLTG